METQILIDAINTQWLMLMGCLIFFMQAGFALLESGSVRHKNYQNILLKNIMDSCVAGIVFWMWGYSIAFGRREDSVLVKEHMFGHKVEQNSMMFFQYAFACTSSTIVSGSLAERVKIENYILFSFFMTGIIYPVVVSWTWGKGWLY